MDKALLILDLDETLIFGTRTSLDIPFDFKVGPYFIYLRPNCLEFLVEASHYYQLAIWSSAGEDYVKEISEYFIKNGLKFEFVWSRKQATYKRAKFDEYNYINSEETHQFYIKKLSKVNKLAYPIERILIVDDSPHKSSENYGNAIYPKAFTGDLSDSELRRLIKYLVSIRDITNYRTIEKRFWRDEIR